MTDRAMCSDRDSKIGPESRQGKVERCHRSGVNTRGLNARKCSGGMSGPG